MSAAPAGLDLREVEQFLYREARLADEHAYDEWEALWADDGVYWVPAGGDDVDPGTRMSIINDNRHRISTRIKQLKTGKRHAQTPRSRLRRVVSNVEQVISDTAADDADTDPGSGTDAGSGTGVGSDAASGTDAGEVTVAANFVLVESRERGTHVWAGRTTYRLRRVGDDWRLVRKTVTLVDNDRAVPTLGFLI